MGTWSSSTFGNDYAMDWAQDLQEYKNLELIESTLDYVIDNGAAELEAPVGAEALAAVEVLLLLAARDQAVDAAAAATEIGEEIRAWVAARKQKATPYLLGKAAAALELVLAGTSELDQLWRESDDHAAWRTGVAALQDAVRQRLLA
jgi:hypothetical protein